MKYFALIAHDHPVERPLMVVRVGRAGRAERYGPSRGWTPCDPLHREWFVNVPITEEHANAVLDGLADDDPDDTWDPRGPRARMYASEGYGPEWLDLAVETDEHPFDDPLTVVRHHVSGTWEIAFTRDLVWRTTPVPLAGRRVRVTEEYRDRFEEVQARRVFGDAEIRHFAVTNPLYPDPAKPSAIARERVDAEGVFQGETYGPDGTWTRSSTIFQVRHGVHDGGLTPVTERVAARLVKAWKPRPRTVRYFLCRDKAGARSCVARVWDEDGLLREEKVNHDSDWVGTSGFLSGHHFPHRDHRPVEVGEDEALERVEAVERANGLTWPEDGRYRYHAIVHRVTDDVLTARMLVRSRDGHRAQSFSARDGKWRQTFELLDIRTGHSYYDEVPITEEVAERLREVLIARFTER